MFKLASRLSTDVSRAVREIENLQRQVQRLKTAAAGNTRPAGTPHGKPTTRTPHTTKIHSTTSHAGRPRGHNETKPSPEASEFVFPKEPFNPPSPPERTPSGNN